MPEPRKPLVVDVVLPARNAELTIARTVEAIPAGSVRFVVVVDHGSFDGTRRVAEEVGARVVREERPGHGAACLRGVEYLADLPRPPDAVVFCPSDDAYDPGEIPALVQPLQESLFDLAIGLRTPSRRLDLLRLRAGNLAAVSLIRAIYGHRYGDLSPFRAVRYPALVALGLHDRGSGWEVEMQVKALKVGLRVAEVPVSFRPRPAPLPLPQQARGALAASAKSMYQILRHATAR